MKKSERIVLDCVAENSGLLRREVEVKTGLSRTTTSDALLYLSGLGKIDKRDYSEKKSIPYKYYPINFDENHHDMKKIVMELIKIEAKKSGLYVGEDWYSTLFNIADSRELNLEELLSNQNFINRAKLKFELIGKSNPEKSYFMVSEEILEDESRILDQMFKVKCSQCGKMFHREECSTNGDKFLCERCEYMNQSHRRRPRRM